MTRRHFLAVTTASAWARGSTARRYVRTRFGNIAYLEQGSGDTALFLHGFPLNSFQWRGALDRLAPHRRCIAPDFMAMGHTQVASGQSVAPGDQADMLVSLLNSLRIPTVDVIANDSGGAVAQLFVTRYRSRVRTLLLTNCDTEPDCPPAALKPVIELSRAGKYADQWLVPWLADKALARSGKGIGGLCYADREHPTDKAIENYFAPLVSSPARKALIHEFALALERNSLAGLHSKLKRCDVPARIVWGMGDTIFSPNAADYLDHAFPKSRGVRRLAGRKLFWPEELPEVVAQEALLLWRSV